MTRFALPNYRRLLAVAILGFAPGCAAITNPVADGVPVHRLPEEIFPPPREELKPLPLTLLRQPKAGVYRLAAGDVLGVYVQNLLGDKTTPPPVRIPETGSAVPAIGYPVPVQDNGTIVIPFADPIKVAGLTIDEAREAVRVAVTVTKQLVPPENARILVTLMQPRKYHVIVVRQDTGAVSIDPNTGGLGAGKRGSGFPIDLPAGENDVLNALARTGGLPGLDANNEVIIQRGAPPGTPPDLAAVGETTRIPLRVRPGEPPTFRPEDVILKDGDIVFIESRDTELFYTAGLLPIGEYVLPRDYDLDVVEAVAKVHGPLVNGGFNQQNQFASSLVAQGLGFPSPSLVTVLRKTSDGRNLRIRVDLSRALRDPRERILVQSGDILVLQEKPAEAIVRYTTQIFRVSFLFNLVHSAHTSGTNTISVP
jgi:protein involved in polysaccharide export with SLBB domain